MSDPRYYRQKLTDSCGNVAIYQRDRIHVEIAFASPCYADLIVAALNDSELLRGEVGSMDLWVQTLKAELADARAEIAALKARYEGTKT